MRRLRHKAATAAAALTTVATVALSSCTLPTSGDVLNKEEAKAAPVAIGYSFKEGAADVTPTGAEVTAKDGTLSSVSLYASDANNAPIETTTGTTANSSTSSTTSSTSTPKPGVAGELSADKTSWKPTEPLDYGQHYTAEVTATNADGEEKTEKRSFTVLTPENSTEPTLMSSGGVPIESDREYGVGLVLSVRFDSPPTDRRKAEQMMHVSTNPQLEGNWYWITPYQADWRPREYYPSGTEVNVDINLAGHDLGGGQFVTGKRQQAHFRIGEKRVAIADDNDKILRMYQNDELINELPTSMGMGGYANHGGVSMHFWTQPGIYTVLDKTSHILMDSSTYGLPVESGGYKTPINNAVRISNDGIYLHELGNIWAQGVQNVSHGCLNLSPANAQIYFNWAIAGDIVEVRNTGGPPLQPWQNGDWSVPWEEWQTGEADF